MHELRSWRLLSGKPWLRVAVLRQGQSPMCAGLNLRPIGGTPALSVTQSVAAAAVCCLWRVVMGLYIANIMQLEITGR